jgi:hypothetical protein
MPARAPVLIDLWQRRMNRDARQFAAPEQRIEGRVAARRASTMAPIALTEDETVVMVVTSEDLLTMFS